MEPDISSESRLLPMHPICMRPSVRGEGFPSEYCRDVWCAKTRMVWLPDGEKISHTVTRFDRIDERVRQTDRQTDGQTPRDGIGRADA